MLEHSEAAKKAYPRKPGSGKAATISSLRASTIEDAVMDRERTAYDLGLATSKLADREALIAVISDYQACGSCAGAPEDGQWCKACHEEADAILASGIIRDEREVLAELRAAVLELHPVVPRVDYMLSHEPRYPGCPTCQTTGPCPTRLLALGVES